MHEVTFTRTFHAAHRVWSDKGKCANIHGHSYHATIAVKHDELDGQGFIIPFDRIKLIVDQYDHALILDLNDPLVSELGGPISEPLRLVLVAGLPSTEFMATWIAAQVRIAIAAYWPDSPVAAAGGNVQVHLRETEGIEATGWA